jgi:hypothetical protein
MPQVNLQNLPAGGINNLTQEEAALSLNLDQLKQQIFNNLRYRLGDGIIDLELDPEHYEAAYNYAIATYRQKAEGAYEEAYILMRVIGNQNTYQLPQEVQVVREAFRRTVGLETGPGASSFDPFSSAILNTYLLNYNYAGGLATYELYAGYIELAARMFGGYLIYNYNNVSKKIQIMRDFKGTGEEVLLWVYQFKPEIQLLQAPQTVNWISSWTLCQLKMIIGEAREKFSSIPGPGGSTTLNGTAMKAEAKAGFEELLLELKNYQDWSQPLTWVQG